MDLSIELPFDTGLVLKFELVEDKKYICKHGHDRPEIRNWKWSQ